MLWQSINLLTVFFIIILLYTSEDGYNVLLYLSTIHIII